MVLYQRTLDLWSMLLRISIISKCFNPTTPPFSNLFFPARCWVTGIISRSAPALNLFSLGLPAGVLAGIAGLIVAAPVLTDQASLLTQEALEATAEILQP